MYDPSLNTKRGAGVMAISIYRLLIAFSPKVGGSGDPVRARRLLVAVGLPSAFGLSILERR